MHELFSCYTVETMKKFRALVTMPQAWEPLLEKTKQILDDNQVDFELIWSDGNLPKEQLLSLLADKDGYLVCLDRVDQEILTKSKHLKVIAKHGVGLDNIDLEAATKAKIAVCNTRGSNSEAVADLTLALLLAVSRSVCQSDLDVRRGMFPQFLGSELAGKQLGIVGLGEIGKKVAHRAKVFGMHLTTYSRSVDQTFCTKYEIKELSLAKLLEQSDVITLHLPVNEASRLMINRDTLSQMKRGAFLINTSRGGLVDEEACAEALHSGQLGAAALDVFNQEPPDIKSALLQAPNTLFTSHLGGTTKESIQRSSELAATNLVEVLHKRACAYVVNEVNYQQ